MLRTWLPCLVLAWCAAGWADEQETVGSGSTAHPEWTGAETFDLDSASYRFYLGHFVAPAQSQLKAPSDDISLGMGITINLLNHPYAGIDFAGFYFKHEVDSTVPQPPFGTLDEDARIETGALMFGGRLFYPAKSHYRVYATAGLGYFRTKMRVFGSLFGFPGVFEQQRSTIAPYYGAGVGYSFGDWALSLDYRGFRQEEDFSDFNVNDVDVGGQSITIGLGYNL